MNNRCAFDRIEKGLPNLANVLLPQIGTLWMPILYSKAIPSIRLKQMPTIKYLWMGFPVNLC